MISERGDCTCDKRAKIIEIFRSVSKKDNIFLSDKYIVPPIAPLDT